MNILFISSQFPNSAEPNRGVFSLQIVKELAVLAKVQVIAPVPTLGLLKFTDAFKRYKTGNELSDTETIDTIIVHHPKYFAMPGMGFTHSDSMFTTLKPLIEDIHSCWCIDAVNCHWVFPDGVAVQKICEQLNIPILLTPLGTDLNRFINFRLRKQAITNALVKADKVSVLSTPMLKLCISLGVNSSKLRIIPNGVDLQKFSIQDHSLFHSQLQIKENQKVILFVGSLVPVKGIETLLRAFVLLMKLHEVGTVKLYIVGGGFQEAKLKRLASELHINNDIVFVGRVPHDKLPAWMNIADCLCLPSLSEGHPNVVMEALACGLPVVASAVGAIPDFVNEKTGHLVTPTNHTELSEKLNQCLATPYRRESIRATMKNMSWKRCAEMYYEELLGLTEFTVIR